MPTILCVVSLLGRPYVLILPDFKDKVTACAAPGEMTATTIAQRQSRTSYDLSHSQAKLIALRSDVAGLCSIATGKQSVMRRSDAVNPAAALSRSGDDDDPFISIPGVHLMTLSESE